MPSRDALRRGGCLCGAVRYEVSGEPLRVGLCHCADCRKESGSAFVSFAVWPRATFSADGEVETFKGRSFCRRCGGRLFCLSENDAEIRFGSLDDAPTDLSPAYELWVKRRERWLHPLPDREQFDEDKPEGA